MLISKFLKIFGLGNDSKGKPHKSLTLF